MFKTRSNNFIAVCCLLTEYLLVGFAIALTNLSYFMFNNAVDIITIHCINIMLVLVLWVLIYSTLKQYYLRPSIKEAVTQILTTFGVNTKDKITKDIIDRHMWLDLDKIYCEETFRNFERKIKEQLKLNGIEIADHYSIQELFNRYTNTLFTKRCYIRVIQIMDSLILNRQVLCNPVTVRAVNELVEYNIKRHAALSELYDDVVKKSVTRGGPCPTNVIAAFPKRIEDQITTLNSDGLSSFISLTNGNRSTLSISPSSVHHELRAMVERLLDEEKMMLQFIEMQIMLYKGFLLIDNYQTATLASNLDVAEITMSVAILASKNCINHDY